MPVEVLVLCGVGLYIVALFMFKIPLDCGHRGPCARCTEEEARRFAKNLVDRHEFEHRWWKLSREDCETCKRLRGEE